MGLPPHGVRARLTRADPPPRRGARHV